MKGEALAWYKRMFQNNQFTDCPTFSRTLELCFGPSSYENHQAQLFKLRKTKIVAKYQAQFEKLLNNVLGLPIDALLNCFISGLHPEIRYEIAIQCPNTIITQAIGLAKLIKSKVKDAKPKYPRPFGPTQTTYKPITPSPPNSNPRITPTLTINTSANSTNNRLPIRQINFVQRYER